MPRTIVYAIVEGQTENAVLMKLLATHLGSLGVDLHCPIIRFGTGRGGVKGLKLNTFVEQIQRFLKDKRQPVVTTFFDYYGFPHGEKSGWAFVAEAKLNAATYGLNSTIQSIERKIHQAGIEGINLPNVANRFIPYIQAHELEALFFAEPHTMATVFEIPSQAYHFLKAVTECNGDCEKINNSPQTAPSKRIQTIFPGYIKGRSDFAHGPRLAEKLTLSVVRKACPRFSSWVSSLERLAPN
jgi:hypothetical protein